MKLCWAFLALALIGCDGKTYYDDDAPLSGPSIKIEVYRLDPPAVDLAKYSILDLSETVSQPTEVMPVVETASIEDLADRPIKSFGAKVLTMLGMDEPAPEPIQAAPHGDDRAAGYRYARKLGVIDANYCRGNSISFVDGCMDYMLGMQSTLETTQ